MASYGSKLAIKINYVRYYFYLQTNYLVSYQNLNIVVFYNEYASFLDTLQRRFLKLETICSCHFNLQASFFQK